MSLLVVLSSTIFRLHIEQRQSQLRGGSVSDQCEFVNSCNNNTNTLFTPTVAVSANFEMSLNFLISNVRYLRSR